ncbi:hypothetical protein SS50377_27874 [Spironucleus salmonicida]|uniref:Uncharacterized protein n=1 Tax=Spironucleus salmonicida TaxID=348837 RepID=V6LYL3_9EUKA|nr:hypothetical protein SS50377_27874 [Spironucleus salmonicida]|eukprot:EST48811.1 Hypothetical protein SS50377_10906 [Spironucleus salmonicida]
MNAYKHATGMTQKEHVTSFLTQHLQNPTSHTKQVLDFLILHQAKIVAIFMRKHRQQLNTPQLVEAATNDGFTRQYMMWLLYDAAMPATNSIFDYCAVINESAAEPASAQQILHNGDAKSVAELIFKSFANLLQITPSDRHSAPLATPQLPSLPQTDYHVLLDSRLELTAFEQQPIGAAFGDVFALLVQELPEKDVKKVLRRFEFTLPNLELSEELGEIVCDEDIIFACQDVLEAIFRKGSLPKESIPLLELVSAQSVQESPHVFAELLTALCTESGDVYFFNRNALRITKFTPDFSQICSYKLEIQRIQASIRTIFLSDKELLSILLSVTSPDLLLTLAADHYPQIDLPQLLILRAYQDGPQFVNGVLERSVALLAKIPFELLYFVLEFSTKIVWLLEDTEVFQSQSCQNTRAALENFVNHVNEFYGISIQQCGWCVSSDIIVKKSVEITIKFLLDFDFDVAQMAQYLASLAVKNEEINTRQIVQQVLVEISEIIADGNYSVEVRAKFFQFLVYISQKYNFIMSPILQTTDIMQESGWQQVILVNIIRAIKLYHVKEEISTDIMSKISEIEAQIANINTQLQYNILQAQQSPNELKSRFAAISSSLQQKKQHFKSELIQLRSTSKQQTTAPNPSRQLIKTSIIDLLDSLQIRNKPFLLNILKNLSQLYHLKTTPFFDFAQFSFVVKCNILPPKALQKLIFVLNRIVPATAYSEGQEVAQNHPNFVDFIARFVVLDRLISDPSEIVLGFLAGLLGAKSSISEHLMLKFVLPLLVFVNPRFPLLKNALGKVPQSNASLMSINVIQLAVLVQKLNVFTPKIERVISYFHVQSAVISVDAFLKFTEFVRNGVEKAKNLGEIAAVTSILSAKCEKSFSGSSLSQFRNEISLIMKGRKAVAAVRPSAVLAVFGEHSAGKEGLLDVPFDFCRFSYSYRRIFEQKGRENKHILDSFCKEFLGAHLAVKVLGYADFGTGVDGAVE